MYKDILPYIAGALVLAIIALAGLLGAAKGFSAAESLAVERGQLFHNGTLYRVTAIKEAK